VSDKIPAHPHAAQQPVTYTLGQAPAWEGLPAPKPVTELKTRHRARGETTEAPPADASEQEPAAQTSPTTEKKPTAKKTTAKKSTAKKTTAKKSTAKKTTAKKTAAKKPAAKKPAAKTEE
jgi:hypothetical protein